MKLGKKNVSLNQEVLLKIFEQLNGSKLKHRNCPGCGSMDVSIFYDVQQVPAHSVLLMPTRRTAINYPKGNIVLGFCHNCGFISNFAFDRHLLEYSPKCEESQGFSPTFNHFHRRLADYLIDKYDLRNKHIIEIGCGKGEFLNLLCRLGDNRAIGFDPAYVPDRNHDPAERKITFIQDFFSDKYNICKADFICCKMTLEHIHQTANFMNTLRRSIDDQAQTPVFFQIPDAERILRQVAFWDIYYEHCSYFTSEALIRLFENCGFDVLNTWTDYNAQYLMIEAVAGDNSGSAEIDNTSAIHRTEELVCYFAENYQSKLHRWKVYLNDLYTNRQKVVLWGASSKAVAFLTTLRIYDHIEYVVDINTYRSGSYIAGTGQKIVAPEFLRDYKPDVVIVMNPIYKEEIRHTIDDMGLKPELKTPLLKGVLG